MASGALSAEGQMEELVATAQKQVEALERAVSCLAWDEREVKRQRQEVTEEVGARYDTLLRWLNRSHEELLEKVTARSDSVLANLKVQENEAGDVLESLSRLVMASFSISQASPEIPTLKSELQVSLLGDNAFSHFSKLGESGEQKVYFPLTSDPSVLDLGTIRTYMGEIMTPGRTTPDLSLKKQVLQAQQRSAGLEDKLAATEKTLQDFEAKLKAMEQNHQQALQALQVKQQSTEKLAQEAKTNTAALDSNLSTQIRVVTDKFEKGAVSLEAKLTSTESQLRKTVDGCRVLETKMQAAESRLDTVQTRVAFNVWQNSNPLMIQGKGVLVLDCATLNIGSAYDSSTGVFTSPLPGLYNFQVTIMTHRSHAKSGNVGLYVDDVINAITISDSNHGHWDQATVRAVLHLNKSQKVYLKNVIDSPTAFFGDTRLPYTSFSGFLLQAD